VRLLVKYNLLYYTFDEGMSLDEGVYYVGLVWLDSDAVSDHVRSGWVNVKKS